MLSLVFLWILNFVISIFNAWGCGKAWNQTADGLWARLMLWSGAVMSACGFTWCYLVVLVALSHAFGWLPPQYNTMAAEIGYVILIPVVITSGLVITVDSWVYFARRRTLGGGLTAAYNTYATYRNISGAIRFFPDAIGDIMSTLGGSGSSKSSSSSDDDSKGKLAVIALALVLVSLLGGILTTRYIILSTADTRS